MKRSLAFLVAVGGLASLLLAATACGGGSGATTATPAGVSTTTRAPTLATETATQAPTLATEMAATVAPDVTELPMATSTEPATQATDAPATTLAPAPLAMDVLVKDIYGWTWRVTATSPIKVTGRKDISSSPPGTAKFIAQIEPFDMEVTGADVGRTSPNGVPDVGIDLIFDVPDVFAGVSGAACGAGYYDEMSFFQAGKAVAYQPGFGVCYGGVFQTGAATLPICCDNTPDDSVEAGVDRAVAGLTNGPTHLQFVLDGFCMVFYDLRTHAADVYSFNLNVRSCEIVGTPLKQ